MKKSFIAITAFTMAFAATARSGSVVFDNFSGTFNQIQANGVAIPAGTGFVAVGTSALTPADLANEINASGELSLAGRAALAADFVQFGDSITFGFGGFDGYFQGNAQGDGGAADFAGKPVLLVAGNGTGIADSSSLLIMAGPDTFAADAPVFSTNVGPDSGQLIYGAAGGTNSLDAGFGAIQMGAIPEPGIAILTLFSAGLLLLRRSRSH